MDIINRLWSTARTTEVAGVSDRIIAEYDDSDWSTDAHLTGIFNKLKPETQRLTIAVNRIKAESNLEEKDEVRDSKVKAIYYLLLGLLHHPEAAIKNAAEEVDNVFEHYGVDIVEKSYTTESVLVESLLIDFANPDLQTALAALPGMTQLIDELRAAQTDFEAAKVVYEKELVILGSQENATEIKKEVLDILNNKLVVYLRAMFQVDEEKYGLFTKTAAKFIDDMNILIKKRRKDSTAALEG